jgi:glycosyltransferase involved in cell wall biosynthesis
MRYLFIHKQLPGQFEGLIKSLLDDPNNAVVGIGQEFQPLRYSLLRLGLETYELADIASPGQHPTLRVCADDIAHGLSVAEVLNRLRQDGYVPDLAVAHLGWGEATYFKDIFPDTPLLGYCEFFYRARGADVDFDPSFPLTREEEFRIRSANAVKMLGLESMDVGVTPTRWQKSLFPAEYQSKIRVIHEGVDVDWLRPDADARFRLPSGRLLTRADRVVTFATRNLEPYRGIETLLRAVALLCRRRQDCQFVIAGGDGISYGAPSLGQNCRQRLSAELGLDSERVHFVGHLPYRDYLSLLQVSSAHVYLTVPFVLSWSMLEAMAAGCVVIGSDTAPVREVLRHGHNGLLVDFFSPDDVAATVNHVLENPARVQSLGQQARADIVARYSRDHALREYSTLMQGLLGRTRVPA